MSIGETILDMVRDAVPGVAVYDGRVPDQHETPGVPPARYVVVYVNDPHRVAEDVGHTSSGGAVHWQVSCVAPDRAMASWLATTIRDAIVDVRPAAAGWSCGLVEHSVSLRPRADEAVQERPAVLVVDQYELLVERT